MVWPLLLVDFVFFLLFLLSFGTKQNKLLGFVLILIATIQFGFIVGLRSATLGYDTPKYVRYFQVMAHSPLQAAFAPYWQGPFLIWRGDAGINVLMWFLGQIGKDSTFFLIAMGIIMASLIGWSIYLSSVPEEEKVLVIIFFFLSYAMLLQFGNTLRQGLCLAVLQVALVLWKDRKRPWWALAVWFLATEVHMVTAFISMGIVIGYWVIKKLHTRRLGYFVFLALAFGLSILFRHVLERLGGTAQAVDYAKLYANFNSSNVVFYRVAVVLALSALFALMFKDYDDLLYLNLATSLVVMLVSRNAEMVKRVMPLLFLTQPVLLVRLLRRFKLENWIRLIVGTAYVAGGVIFAILPPMAGNYQY